MKKKGKSPCEHCPYHLGLVKVFTDPCIRCKLEKRDTPPFPVPVIKKNKEKENSG